MMFRVFSPIALVLLFCFAAKAEEGSGHVALIIGNASYHSLPGRVGFGAEIDVLAEALRAVGYTTVICKDPSSVQIDQALDLAAASLPGDGVFFLYWSGYAAKVDGSNYLLGANAPPPSHWEGGVPPLSSGLTMVGLIERVSRLPGRARIVALEAQKIPGEQALSAPAEIPRDMLIALIQPPSALDLSSGLNNGLLASVLARLVPYENLAVDEMFAWARVMIAARAGDRNMPWVGSGLSAPVMVAPRSARHLLSGAPSIALPSANGLADWAPGGWVADTLDHFSMEDGRSFGSIGPRLPAVVVKSTVPVDEPWAGIQIGLPRLREVSAYSDAVQWYEHSRGKLQGERPEFELGLAFAEGRGVRADNRMAEHWFLKASELGDAEAQYRLGLLFRGVAGVARDDGEAFIWFRRAADRGSPAAMNEVGDSYLKGLGAAKDSTEAMRWFRRAADLGVVDAMHSLAVGYATGDGLTKNCVEAKGWLGLAADGGHKAADQELHSTLGECAWW